MAMGWMTLLKLVPWSDVIRNAPAVADGARKLWDAAGRKPAPAEAPGTAVGDAAPHDVLLARLAQAEQKLAVLQEQMQASSTLIKALAEQNTELIRCVETNRSRVLWLAALVAMFGAIAGMNLAVTLWR